MKAIPGAAADDGPWEELQLHRSIRNSSIASRALTKSRTVLVLIVPVGVMGKSVIPNCCNEYAISIIDGDDDDDDEFKFEFEHEFELEVVECVIDRDRNSLPRTDNKTDP